MVVLWLGLGWRGVTLGFVVQLAEVYPTRHERQRGDGLRQCLKRTRALTRRAATGRQYACLP